MKWYKLYNCFGDESYFKSHSVPESLKSAILFDLKKRGMDTHEEILIENQIEIDAPGPISINRSWKAYDIEESMQLTIPYVDIEFLYNDWSKEKERRYNHTRYYKLHGYMHCVVLTPKQYETLMLKIKNSLIEVQAVASLENKAFNDAMKNIKNVSFKPRNVPNKIHEA